MAADKDKSGESVEYRSLTTTIAAVATPVAVVAAPIAGAWANKHFGQNQRYT